VSGNKREVIISRLLEWFEDHGRVYPWRQDTDPYRVLMAEIMLQRTKADQVLPVYRSFLKKFPNPESIVNAAPGEVERFFSMLGLRWRAERVRKLAEALVLKYRGHIPDTRKELLSLPGVGEYVADAVLCFAYGRNVAVVDANVCRVIRRIFGLKARGEARRDPRFRRVADWLLPRNRAKEFNWAMIDFAAMVCSPRKPKCDGCPLSDICMHASKNRG